MAGAVADAPSAPVRVTVVDPSGAKIPGAQVRVFQARTPDEAAIRTLRTNQAGELLLELPAGEYTLQITAAGFLEAQEPVEIGRIARPLVVRLRIETRAETVDVSSGEAGERGVSDGQALVLRGSQLRGFSDNPETLQQQINGLVSTDDGAPPQLRVDGFSNGRLPPKSSIREIRVNQNAYSAQFDQRGNSVVDIFTRPGGNKLQGSFYLSGNGDPMNARNPFLTEKPAYHSILFDGEVDGSIGKRTSYFLGGNLNDLQNNAAIRAQVLDAGYNIVPLAQTVATPLLTGSASVRIDHQFTERHTLTARAEWTGSHQENGGLGTGQLLLPSQAFTNDTRTFTLQLGETAIVNAHVVAETRFQYRRARVDQVPNSTATSLVVQGAFSGGGSPTQTLRDATDNYEVQEYLSLDHGRHFYRMGFRYRVTRDSNASTANFNGQYTFNSIEAYQATMRGIAAGQTAAQIRAAGGGASQYRVTTGTPGAIVSTGDLGLYVEDEWRVRPTFSLTTGLRFESQYGIPDHTDPAPRVGFAWTVMNRKKEPLVRLRGGAGLFYDRFASDNLLTATRENGVLQLPYFVQNPDTFPGSTDRVRNGSVMLSPTVYQVVPDMRSAYVVSEGISADRRIGHYGAMSLAFTHEHGSHLPLSRNANAPQNGVRPLGGTQNVYQFASLGTSDTWTLQPNYSAQFGTRGGINVNYVLRFRESDSGGATTFVSNSYNIAADYGRTQYLARHRMFASGWVNLPYGFVSSSYVQYRSSNRFNVTTGQDNNGDSIYNDRPAFATDPGRTSVVHTAIGDFDTAPVAGQPTVPINLGVAPSLLWVQGQFGREFTFGPKVANTGPVGMGNRSGATDRYFHCFFGVEVQNVLNHTNASIPVGQLTSPYFGRSLSLTPDQSGNTSANRILNAVLSFRF